MKKISCKFALWIAKYGIYKIPDKKNLWWFNQLNGTSPEKTTEQLFDLFVDEEKINI